MAFAINSFPVPVSPWISTVLFSRRSCQPTRKSDHRAAAADDVVETVLFVELFLEVLVFETQLAFSKSLAHHDGQFDQLEGLR